jgi:hypothetical protein
MENAKVHLSAEEQELVQDANVILTKNVVIEKAKCLLVNVSERAQSCFNGHDHLPQILPPRITRGENYKGLPWVAMDYPRCFEKQGVFAVRNIFWWGHAFTCTWHCSGIYKQQVLDVLLKRHTAIARYNWLLYTGNDEWAHEQGDNHREVASITGTEFEQALKQHDFFKLCKYLPLSRWNEAVAFYDTCFEELIDITT